MILIDDKIISDDVVKKQFACNLNSCKGACCIEGDFGAPLEDEEIDKINKNLPAIKSLLSISSVQKIDADGWYTFNENENIQETSLMPDGACVFMLTDALGINFCGIEKAYREGTSDFKKPVSCHLYPVRISYNKMTEAYFVNYDVWDICSAACKKGGEEKIPIYKFVKEALIRKFGLEFYEALEQAVEFSDAD